MKKISILSLLVALVFGGNVFAQNIVNGGHRFSAFLSKEGNVFVCGRNKDSNNSGVLCVGSTAESVSSFTEIEFFSENNITIKQLFVGGSSLFALDCNDNLWACGDNQYGQLGVGNSAQVVLSPERVVSGCLAGTAFDDDGYITGVQSAFVKSNNAYVLLLDGRVVSMGSSAKEMYSTGLGNNSAAASNVPVFVVDADNNPIEHVISVTASDYAAYLLVDDDGDGRGTVYSFGSNSHAGELGRNINGSVWTGNQDGSGLYASPIMKNSKETLSNIIKIAASAGCGIALDEDRYVWTWGNNSWNGLCGWNQSYISSSGVPARVDKGETSEVENDGYYLLALDIAGGCGFCSAITIEGNVVSWGNNKDENGYLGNEIMQSWSTPVYTRLDENTILSHCTSISCGGGHGFAVQTNKSVYCWGYNKYGQLGLNNTENQVYAVPVTLPGAISNPQPTFVLSPKRLVVNPSKFQSQILQVSLNIDKSIQSLYTIRWYKDDVLLKSGKITEELLSYIATSLGTYRVEVEYDGELSVCSTPYKAECAEMTISAEPQNFSFGELTSDCNDIVLLSAITDDVNSTAEYVWWLDENKTKSLGMSIGNQPITVNVENHKAKNGKTSLFVEEVSASSGSIITEEECFPSVTNFERISSAGGYSTYLTGFTVNSNVKLRSVDFKVYAKPSVLANGVTQPVNVDFTVFVYGTKLNNRYLPDKNSICGTLTATLTESGEAVVVTALGNVDLAPGHYYLSIYVNPFHFSGDLKILNATNSSKIQNYDPIEYYGICMTSEDFDAYRHGNLYNLRYGGLQTFTSLVPVTISSDCACTIPTPISISQDVENDVLCSGEITVTASEQENSSAVFTYEWYKDDKTFLEVKNVNSPLVVKESGLYTLYVRDANDAKCEKSSSIEISYKEEQLAVSSQIVGSLCKADNGAVSISVKGGTQPYTYMWNDNVTLKDRNGLKPGTYSLLVKDSKGCFGYDTIDVPTLNTFTCNPEISLVTVSQQVDNANLVVWKKQQTSAIDFYSIYRETASGDVYEKIADVPYSETSIYVDENVNCLKQSYKYKIDATDKCGEKSIMSDYHKTIHLQKNIGVNGEINLTWDGYEGFSFSTYSIYRVTRDGAQEIDRVPSSKWTYTDLNPVAGTLSYYVAVELPNIVDVNEPLQKAEGGPFVIVISNIAEIENETTISNITENAVKVYANQKSIVVEHAIDQNVIVCEATGKKVFEGIASEIPVKTVGVYIVIVGNKTFKVVVN
ncbi:MAG: hypothetical protein MJ197_08335 [Bacteroidales bacterium]|nr:hypothetical protein [Bacteroidales bacterium]